MKKIEQVVIIGMGALGLLFGQRMQENIGEEHICFLMDPGRKKRHAGDRYTVNGQQVKFRMAEPGEIREAPDLAVIATKYSGLREARDMILPLMAEKTTAVSLLNGISSEDILAERIPRGRIPDCVAIGMDAVRVGTDMTFGNMGRWQLGVRSGLGREESAEQKERLEALTAFLDRAGIDYEICGDIRHSMWNKFMINIGINQTCMVYETTYGGAIAPGPVREELIAAMREVMPVAAAEGVMLTEEDLAQDLLLIGRLSADGCPSMRQDAMAGRKSEAELFAGTLIRLAEKHGIAVPVNERYYRIIREREESYR